MDLGYLFKFLTALKQNLTLALTLLTAVGALIAAFGALKSARETRKTSLAQILMEISDAYSSDKMREAMDSLWLYKTNCERNGKNHEEDFAEKLKRGDHYAEKINIYRRLFSHHFHKMRRLLNAGLVDEEFITQLVEREQVDFLIKVVEPLARAKDQDYDRRTFETFRKLHDKPK